MNIKEGTQIIYVPTHAKGDINHPDCEPGFVSAINGDKAFCRFWRKPDLMELRTISYSELVDIKDLVVRDSVPQKRVKNKLKNIETFHTLLDALS